MFPKEVNSDAIMEINSIWHIVYSMAIDSSSSSSSKVVAVLSSAKLNPIDLAIYVYEIYFYIGCRNLKYQHIFRVDEDP